MELINIIDAVFIVVWALLMLLVFQLITEYEEKRNPKITITKIKPTDRNWPYGK
jgi:hypothetical protein